jgi:hypothetical protein
MPIVDTQSISVIEKLPGWRGRIFHSPSLTFGHWDFSSGSSIHEHFHPQEEVWELVRAPSNSRSIGQYTSFIRGSSPLCRRTFCTQRELSRMAARLWSIIRYEPTLDSDRCIENFAEER